MNKAYFSFGLLFGILITTLGIAFLKSGNTSAASGTKRMKIAHTLPNNHPVHAGIEYFAERVSYHSKGALQLDIFPNGQLGSETQSLEQMQAGTLDFAKIGAAGLGNFVEVSKVFSLPYLFQDGDHYWNVLNGEIGQELLDLLAQSNDGSVSGFRGLAYYDAGSRNFYAQKPILTVEDLAGMKVRVMNDPVAIDLMKALGASPTPISWGELYTALQQGVVDGAENNPPSFVSSRHFEICKHFSFDHHSRIPDVLMVSEDTWQDLSAEEQAWVSLAAQESSEHQRAAWDAGVAEALAVMETEGVKVHEIDLKPFVEATEGVRQKYATGQIGEFLRRIQDAVTQ